MAWAETWLLTPMAARSYIKMSRCRVAIIFRYLWGKDLNPWHLYCGLSPICLFIKKTVIYTGCEGWGDPELHTLYVTPSPGDELQV